MRKAWVGIVMVLVMGCYVWAAGEDLAQLRKKAEAGDVDAQVELGNKYALGVGGVSRNIPEAAKWIRMAAEKGNADAQNKFAIMNEGGYGVPRDPKAAVSWFEKAAQQGNTNAEQRLAFCYRSGTYVDKSATKAVKYYQMAAEAGVPDAQVLLGLIYETGLDEVQHDYALALKWLHKAADQGNGNAEYTIGSMYEQGLGVPSSQPQAIEWYQRASRHGQIQARVVLQTMGITPEEAKK